MNKDQLKKELRMEEVDGLCIANSYSQYDKFIPAEEVYKLIESLNEIKEKYHYYKTTIRPDLPGVFSDYNYTTGLLALKEKHDVGQYLGYMTEEEANNLLERSKHGRRKMSSVNQFRGSR